MSDPTLFDKSMIKGTVDAILFQNNDNFYDMKTVELEKEFDNSINTYDIMEDDIQF